MNFSDDQLQAVRIKEGPALILAGPGSGKTTVITHRIRHLIMEGVPKEHILVITFTRAAAREMETRFRSLLKESLPSGQTLSPAGPDVTFGTFHSVFFSVLRIHLHLNTSSIISDKTSRSLLQALAEKEHLDTSFDNDLLRLLSSELAACKSSADPSLFRSSLCSPESFRRICSGYNSFLRNHRLVDFEDMQLRCRDLFRSMPDILKLWQDRYPYILIDEFQDISPLQYEIVRMLAEPAHNLFIVGDDDQSIYRFRGSDPAIMLGFPEDYPEAKQILLKNNYRSREEIVSFASRLIRTNVNRFPKVIHAAAGKGGITRLHRTVDTREEHLLLIRKLKTAIGNGTSPGNIGILFRTASQYGSLLYLLEQAGIPFSTRERGTGLFDTMPARDICCYLRLSLGTGTRQDFLRIMNRPVRFISRRALSDRTAGFLSLKAWYADDPDILSELCRLEASFRALRTMPPAAAIMYIRKKIGYEPFLLNFSALHADTREKYIEQLDMLTELAVSCRDIPEFLSLADRRPEKAEPSPNCVQLMTYHASKGLQFDIVHLPDCLEGITPFSRAVSPEDLEEERRAFYVACTRAARELHIYIPAIRGSKPCFPSRFIEEGRHPW